jgi:polyphosphate kinase
MTSENEYYIHRDISWLSFNYRVLQEAKDPSVPLFERIKFLAIYSSNLDEFFRVRVANHHNLLRVGKKTKKRLDYNPKSILKEIHQVVNRQQEEFSDIFENQIIPELKQHGIYLLRRLDLNEEQREFCRELLSGPHVAFCATGIVGRKEDSSFLNNAALYLAIQMREKSHPDGKDHYGLVKIPSDHLPRFIDLPPGKGQHDVIMLDDIVRHNVSYMFPGYDIWILFPSS